MIKMSEIRFLVALIFIAVAQNQVFAYDNVQPQYCNAPRPVIVPIDHPNYMYWPYFVELHRCGGSCSMISPRIQRCGASGLDIISRTVYDLALNQQKVIQLTNHTSCNCSCAMDPGSCSALEKWNPESCSCVCKNPAGQPFTCPTSFTWNQYLCRCICNVPPKNCPINKVWSPDQCRCACSISALKTCTARNELLDKETCTCYRLPPGIAKRDATGVHRDVMIGCMIAELALLLIVFDIFLYCKFQTGLVTAIQRKCCAKKRQDAETPLRKGNGNQKYEIGNDESPAC